MHYHNERSMSSTIRAAWRAYVRSAARLLPRFTATTPVSEGNIDCGGVHPLPMVNDSMSQQLRRSKQHMEPGLRRILKIGISIGGVLLLAFAAIAGATWHALPDSSDPPRSEPFFAGLGTYSRKVTTNSPIAQRYFDQGLAFLYGFNRGEAIRSFEAAAGEDPNCAMAYWGIAVASGPHLNDMTLDEEQTKAVWKAILKATSLSDEGRTSAVESALIAAVNKRFADPEPEDRAPLDRMYADAMREVSKEYPSDPDVGALTAAAIIELRPWDQWTLDGKPQPGTEDAIQLLSRVLEQAPSHPLALHMLVHAVEASPHPERADTAADRLRDLAPGIEHLLHVPSHLDIRRGRWKAAVVANEKAIAANSAYVRSTPAKVINQIWISHDYHLLAYAALMRGESAKAFHAIATMISTVAGMPPAPSQTVTQLRAQLTDIMAAMPYELHLRFGHWDAMLAEPAPSESSPVALVLWHYARSVAFAAQSQVKQAHNEQNAFLVQLKAIRGNPEWMAHQGRNVLPVAEKMMEGEILYREGRVDPSVSALREAVRREDSLHYIEPPYWMLHVRHALGAVLLHSHRPKEAEVVYRDDLVRHPENGWSLFGLARSLQMQGRGAEAGAITARFNVAWQDADFKLSSSCCCLPCGGTCEVVPSARCDHTSERIQVRSLPHGQQKD